MADRGRIAAQWTTSYRSHTWRRSTAECRLHRWDRLSRYNVPPALLHVIINNYNTFDHHPSAINKQIINHHGDICFTVVFF